MNLQKLTAENRVRDLEIPQSITISGEEVKIPEAVRRKDVHYLLNSSGEYVRAAWISKVLAKTAAALDADEIDVKSRNFSNAIEELDTLISDFVKNKVLKNRRGPGAMSFAQAHENVPEGSIVLSRRSYDQLKEYNKAWAEASSVVAIRYPNLGPGTTKRLRLVINDEPLGSSTIGARIPDLLKLLGDFEDEEAHPEIIDCFLLNPKDLKDGMEGDGDGDLIYIAIDGKLGPRFHQIALERNPGAIKEVDIEQLFKKASRTDRSDLVSYLPHYFDDTPIGPATYAIRWLTFLEARKVRKTSDHPLHDAWFKQAPQAIQLIEFVMDIRKGEYTEAEIKAKLAFIKKCSKDIQEAQNKGNWFTKVVTSATLTDVPKFLKKFDTLQSFVDFAIPTKREI